MGIVIFLVFVAFAGGLVWLASSLAKKRTRELGDLAKTINFAFEPGPFQPGGGPFVGVGQFPVFQEGYNRNITNVLHGRVDDAEVQVFDYTYTTSIGGRTGGTIGTIGGIALSIGGAGGGAAGARNRNTYHFTAVSFTSSGGTTFPPMQLYPEGIFSKIGQMFGGQDINFVEFPEFSKRFVLKSPDENRVRAMIDQPTAAFFEAHQGITVHTSGPYLTVYRANKHARVTDVRPLLDTGVFVYRTLAAAATRARR